MPDGNRGWGVALAVLAGACWATSGLFTRYILAASGIAPTSLAFWRELGTFLSLLLLIGLIRPSWLRVQRRDLPWLMGMGASMGFLHICWNASIMVNRIAVATVFQYNAPILVAVIAWLLWREPLTGRKAAAIVLAVGGTVLIARLTGPVAVQLTPAGFLAGMGTAVSYSFFTIFGKKLAGEYTPWTIVLYVFLFGSLVLTPFQIGQPLSIRSSGGAWLAFAGLIWLTTIFGYALYTLSLRRLQASVAVIVSTAEVPFAAVLSFLILGENLDGWQVLGALLVVSGVILLSWSRPRPKPIPV